MQARCMGLLWHILRPEPILSTSEVLRERQAPASAPRNPPPVLVASPRIMRRKEGLRWKQKRIGLTCSWLFFMFLFF